jgi:hypothetical protein
MLVLSPRGGQYRWPVGISDVRSREGTGWASMGNRLQQLIVITFGAVSLWLFCVRRLRPQGERVRFDTTGQCTVENSVRRWERDVYLLEAKAGQRLKLILTSREQNAVVLVYPPGAKSEPLSEAPAGRGAGVGHWALPRAGIYRIVVTSTRGRATYVLRLEKSS